LIVIYDKKLGHTRLRSIEVASAAEAETRISLGPEVTRSMCAP
jgi:hypothetical protein